MKKCENYSLCKGKIPDWMNRCTTCDLTFGEWDGGKGVLEEYPEYECPICLEIKTCFEQPKCKHPICADCFRIIYFCEIPDELIESRIGKEPEHPYQDVLDQYDLDYGDIESNPEEYPLVVEWRIKMDIWYTLRDALYEELSTEKCCICRIENN
jgi:hypothetical protein